MTFTDSDLKRLQKLNENQSIWGDSEMGFALDCIIPLLARLEAAELYIETDRAYGDSQQLHNCYERWLASKGEK